MQPSTAPSTIRDRSPPRLRYERVTRSALELCSSPSGEAAPFQRSLPGKV